MFKIPHNGHWCSKLPLVESVHLVRNAHEEGPQFLNIKSAGVPQLGVASKSLDNWDLISQRFFSRVKE